MLPTTGQIIVRPYANTAIPGVLNDGRVIVAFVGVVACDPDSPLAAGEGIQYTISDRDDILDARQFQLTVYPASAIDRSELTNRMRLDQISTSPVWRV